MNIINGKKLAKTIELELYNQIKDLEQKPALAAILVGNDPASHLYIKLKEKACIKVGITFHKYLLEENATKQEILDTVNFLNNDKETDGILVQLPLPNRSWDQEIIDAINPKKDADGFHPKTIENFKNGNEQIIPGLPAGIVHLIKSAATNSSKNLEEKNALIICNTKLFGEPINLLLQKDKIKTTTINPDEKNAKKLIEKADIIIIAIGQANFLKPEMVKDDAIIIDVGINKTKSGVTGDADFKAFEKTNVSITPVPGGVGPMTVSMLLFNVWKIKEPHTKI